MFYTKAKESALFIFVYLELFCVTILIDSLSSNRCCFWNFVFYSFLSGWCDPFISSFLSRIFRILSYSRERTFPCKNSLGRVLNLWICPPHLIWYIAFNYIYLILLSVIANNCPMYLLASPFFMLFYPWLFGYLAIDILVALLYCESSCY